MLSLVSVGFLCLWMQQASCVLGYCGPLGRLMDYSVWVEVFGQVSGYWSGLGREVG